MQLKDHSIKQNIPKLAVDGSNWVIFRDRLLWVLDTNSLSEHLAHDTIPASLLRLQGAVSLISVRVWFSGDLGNRGKVPQVLGTSRKWSSLRLSFHNSEIGAEAREGDKNLD
jgi:hypothetical protein